MPRSIRPCRSPDRRGPHGPFYRNGPGILDPAGEHLGFTPAGFSGLSIYPDSVFAADLLVSFSQTITDFSIMYAPEEYACDSSATMRVTAYMGSTLVGTNTTTADPPGTWPTGTLTFSSTLGFDNVVVHYDSPPPTGGDWGPIFMADNMIVTTAAPRRYPSHPRSPCLLWERWHCSPATGSSTAYDDMPRNSQGIRSREKPGPDGCSGPTGS